MMMVKIGLKSVLFWIMPHLAAHYQNPPRINRQLQGFHNRDADRVEGDGKVEYAWTENGEGRLRWFGVDGYCRRPVFLEELKAKKKERKRRKKRKRRMRRRR